MLNPQALQEYWQTISSADKKDSKLAAAAAQACTAIGDCATAHQIIEQSLDAQWDSELAELYAECSGSDAISQIERAEAWLKSHPNDACLLLALGKLCVHCELWGKAQNYLEASLSVEPGLSRSSRVGAVKRENRPARTGKGSLQQGTGACVEAVGSVGQRQAQWLSWIEPDDAAEFRICVSRPAGLSQALG